ncbi:hypothetical protein [Priestia taiwanensis]|uniref:Uncharacterized protein n=1 Tax=Priestia taiwanensis TaxID=1347902 RepID=A0A917ARH5_9BACI|nr:hypothetical protein [Priestia taiwanensis]MBM7363224.1 hypothetical protein [Priestia taiwanensis]GGE68676.1 hypothetical protein GCM10007140_18430 [Priestia taiwanensis]
MNASVRVLTTLKGVNGVLELLIAFPFLIGLSSLAKIWELLVIMFFLHMLTLLLLIITKLSYKTGSLLGLLASIVGFIPFIGMLLHISTAVLNLSECYQLHRGRMDRW